MMYKNVFGAVESLTFDHLPRTEVRVRPPNFPVTAAGKRKSAIYISDHII